MMVAYLVYLLFAHLYLSLPSFSGFSQNLK